MPRARPVFTAMNGGEFGSEMKSQIDFERYRLAGERVENWIPMITGGMLKCPGFKTIAELSGDAHLRGFDSTRDLGYLAVFQAGTTTFYYDEEAVQTGAPVNITNGTFAGASPTSWTDSSTGGASIAGNGPGLRLIVPPTSPAVSRADQAFTAATPNTRHNVKVDVTSGPVTISFGSTQGTSNYASGTVDAGEHFFEIVPDSSFFWCRIESSERAERRVESIVSIQSTAVSIVNPYTVEDLDNLRADQLNDTMFIASGSKQLVSLARRGETAFGLGREYLFNGPFSPSNSESVTISANAVNGTPTLTASDPIFEPGSVGQSISISHPGQSQSNALAAENSFTDEIEISGSGTFRRINVFVGNLSGNTVSLQRSVNEPGNWEDVEDYTSFTNKTFDDELDGQTFFYRIGIKTGNYAGGTTNVSLATASGSTTGEVEIIGYTSPTTVGGRVVSALGSTAPTSTFSLSIFGGDGDHPIEIAFQEGRMFIASSIRVFGSVSDDFTNFEASSLDDGAIDRQPSSQVRWLESMGDLGVGENRAVSVASSGEFDAPYTPSNFRIRPDIKRGAAFVEAEAIDSVGMYVDRDTETLMEVVVDEGLGKAVATPMTRLNPRICFGGIKRIQQQVSPDPRVWVRKTTGELVCMTYARNENVVGWWRRPIDAIVLDIAVARGKRRDRVYALVEREIAGVTRRFLCVLDNELFTEPAEANHLDFSYTPIKPDTPDAVVTPSGVSGTITVSANTDVFSAGDTGKTIFLSEGMGSVTFVNAREISVAVTNPLKNTRRVSPGFWFMGSASSAVSGLTGLENQTVSAWIDGVQYDNISVDGSGNATLPVQGAWVHVGIVMPPAVFKSMKLYQGGARGAAMNGVTKRVHEIGVDLLRTCPGLRLGAGTEDDTFPVFDSRFIDGRFYTGEHRQSVNGTHESDPRAVIIAEGVGPAYVLSYAAGLKANER